MMNLDLRRRFFAEELEAVCKLRSPARSASPDDDRGPVWTG
jgi:hypothetical protein